MDNPKKRSSVPTPKKIPANNKQGYKWKVVLEGPPDPITGKRQQVPRVRDTQKEATAAAQAVVDLMTKGLDVKKAKQTTFEEAAYGWLADYALTGVAESTVDQREVTIQSILKHIAKGKLDKITHTQYQQILNKLFEKGLSKSSIKSFHSVTKMIFEWAIINNLCAVNPTEKAKIPKRQKTVEEIENESVEELYLEHEEINEFLDTVVKHGKYGDKEVFFLLVYSGLRPGEACALKYTDIDVKNKRIRVTKTLYTPKNNMYKAKVKPPKTDGSVRSFTLDDVIIEMIQAFKEVAATRHSGYQRYHDDYYDGGFIFARDNGRPFSQTTLINRMARIIKITNITKKATPHIFRHTHISMLTEAGIDLATIMQRVGHDDEKTTLKIYTHITRKMQKDASEKASIHFGSILNPHLLQEL
ncbi:tyrosine-type recombinase/integrase [Paenibacillus donghaensis]|uniref:Site-specific integrase n=1 Tax=Paenibacillus donghaensis TaxID=414771 RepID=A0A2Z2KFQ8_9BACL|nr:site-specific integrase [Paenibacillus donghaensis]ASA22003.1 hypothetical protein B9T62_15200 [Paenibacillus donghaensis]